MNYPIWEVPAAGLFIAGIAILHVFISHFAVGGGLFLVLAERRARRSGDTELLGYVRSHSGFFILLTLVLGAITGVGIWFTIGLVHPQATSSLILTWVWGWAIEWTFFLTEIVAAMVYYYGWDRLSPRTHERVGWVYFWSAWLSLFVINGILTYMLTPGAWPTTRGFVDGFFNPTFWPALVARTAAAVGLAGIYALLTSAYSSNAALRASVARYAVLGWVLPAAVVLPASMLWYLAAAAGAGVPVGGVLGAASDSVWSAVRAAFSTTQSGYPVVQRAAVASIVASGVCVVLSLAVLALRHRTLGKPLASLILASGIVALGGAEWVREGLRKPYVIGRVMFVNGVRLPVPDGGLRPPEAVARALGEDRFSLDAVNREGVLRTAGWLREHDAMTTGDGIQRQAEEGRQVFGLLCTSCHTRDGYLAIRPLVDGRGVAAIETTLERLARPVDASGAPTSWTDPDVRLATWRGRHMPPLVGTEQEKHALAVHLAMLGGLSADQIRAESAAGDAGQQVFDAHCAMCHGDDGEWPMTKRPARPATEFYELLGRLSELNEVMPPFEGTDEERRALSDHLARLTASHATPEATR
jgi:mono/diheme cytochrome c family protein/cytochrome bd-type quinol oxidase subunit 1